MSLIDAAIGICVSALFTIACGALILPDGFWAEFRKLVAGEPTIDRPTRSQFERMAAQLGYEPVVHCKDCKHLMFSDCYGECGAARMRIVSPYDFCSYGERRSE